MKELNYERVFNILVKETSKMGNGFTHSGTCKKELESTIRKIVKEEHSQW